MLLDEVRLLNRRILPFGSPCVGGHRDSWRDERKVIASDSHYVLPTPMLESPTCTMVLEPSLLPRLGWDIADGDLSVLEPPILRGRVVTQSRHRFRFPVAARKAPTSNALFIRCLFLWLVYHYTKKIGDNHKSSFAPSPDGHYL